MSIADKVVTIAMPKRLLGITQNRTYPDIAFLPRDTSPSVPPAKRRVLTQLGMKPERGKPVWFPEGRRTARDIVTFSSRSTTSGDAADPGKRKALTCRADGFCSQMDGEEAGRCPAPIARVRDK
jgi:hypothetical protein